MKNIDKKVLKNISADNTLAYYLDSNNIRNQVLVQDTISHIQTYRSNLFTPLEFLNLLRQQYLFVINRPDTSEFGGQATDSDKTLKELKSLPLTKLQQHILFYFIIKWFGGVGGWSHPKINGLIENEFKSYKSNTPEKDMYFANAPKWLRLTFKQFSVFKSDFEKLNYPEKLIFWDKHIYNDTQYVFSSIGLPTGRDFGRDTISLEYTISIFPKNAGEIKLHNQWLFDHITKDNEYKTLSLEYLKERYFDTIENNPRPIEYTEQEIATIDKKKSRQKILLEAKNDIILWGYYCGYQSIVRNENTHLTLPAEDFKKIAEEYIKGRNDAFYLGFLENQLIALKKGKKPQMNPKKKNSPSVNAKQRYLKYVDTYNVLTREKKLDHAKAVDMTCKEHGISEKTLNRAIKFI